MHTLAAQKSQENRGGNQMTEHSISKIDIWGENQFGNVYFSINIQNTG